MKNTIIAAAATLILAPTLALAGNNDHKGKDQYVQYTGPVESVSVASLLAESSMFTEKDAVVDGKIVKQINKDTFVFSDGESEIQIELDDDIKLNQPLTADTSIRIFGEFEGGNTPEIEVEHIQLL
ncbi:NirD/YgiW/YdeI family stress tolerance protein [Vibrio sp. T187]|uniref:YgiW/YdeI family stress tolerance OB fold protein n=1 Tax=Vibrio TaxID=662 RepID=UPI0010C9B597|nr:MULTISPECIES: NirD/YgiW/YdeI family stress tolerance protein [Vibrio]MBW3698076.1 NirD/YgiW/YdeI family stress tolerance protein [Vibrio sp. T187]